MHGTDGASNNIGCDSQHRCSSADTVKVYPDASSGVLLIKVTINSIV